VARAAIDGISRGQGDMGIDVGASEAPMVEDLASGEDTAPVAGETFELLAAPRGAPDDLSKLPGVGPQLEKKLNEAGVFHYWQIAAMGSADVAALDTKLKLNGRMAREDWVGQARSLIDAA
jgi:small subunit ribosomal protein S2